MPRDEEHRPGERAPATGDYEQLNIFGTPTGWVVQIREGEPLPAAPSHHTWRRTTAGC
jgi:hypothetical protein